MTYWAPVLTLDSVDRSASVVGQLRVEAEEAAARTASFRIRPPAGTVTAGDWLGVPVTIDYRTRDAAGNPISTERVFTGIVDQALYDPKTQTTAFECTDNLPEAVNQLTQAQVEALVPAGRYSPAAHGDYQSGWQHLEHLQQTTPQAYDYDRTGAGVLTDWAAKATPDFTFGTSQIFDGSLAYSLAPRRDLVNQVTIEYQYRFRRYKHREHAYSWVVYGDFCDRFNRSHDVATQEMIREAAAVDGWQVQGDIAFTLLPATGAMCGGAWIISEALRNELASGASWTATRRWQQDATETYTLTVQAPQSVTWLGAIARTESASAQTESAGANWEQGTDTPTGRTDSLGDICVEQHDRTVSDNDLETLISQARCQILDAHRANWIEGRVELQPTLERSHTVQLNGGALAGRGKVRMLRHEMDLDSGQASTLIRIAIFLNGNQAAITDDAIAAPAAPDTDPISTPPAASTILDTHLGGDEFSPVYDQAWNGFTGNYELIYPASEEYPVRFRVDGGAVAQDAIDEATGTAAASFDFNIPHELLTITVPA